MIEKAVLRQPFLYLYEDGKVHTMIDDGFGYWFSGFVDGEGSFGINGSRGYCRCEFVIRLRLDDRSILEEIQARTGLGGFKLDRGKPTSPNQNPTLRWAVAKKEETVSLCAIFDKYPLRAKKRLDYEVWRRAVMAWQEILPGCRWRTTNWQPMFDLKAELEEIRRFRTGNE